MKKYKLVRVTTIPIALEKLLEGQISYMSNFFEVIAVSSEKKRLESYGVKNNVKVYSINLTRKITPITDFISLIKFIIFLKKTKPLIVHSHTPKAGLISMIAAFFSGIPIRIHTVAGLPLMEANGLKKNILILTEKITYFFATKILPNSFSLKQYIIDNKFTKPKKLYVIHNGSSNGIDTRYFSRKKIDEKDVQELKNALSISKKDFVFLYVGRVVSHKGINELVTSFKKVNQIRNNVKLLIVGDFEMELDPISTEVHYEILNNKNIIFTGWKNDVRKYFCVSDLFVFPSYREGFPNVILQSLCMELPCIVTNINGCNEIIKNNYNGLIVDKKNTKNLTRGMLKLYDNPQMLEKFKINTREEVVKNFDRINLWKNLKEEYFNQIEKYISE